jgi:hypothetical protein
MAHGKVVPTASVIYECDPIESFHKTMEWLSHQEWLRHERELDLERLRELYPETVETDIEYVDLAVADYLGLVHALK